MDLPGNSRSSTIIPYPNILSMDLTSIPTPCYVIDLGRLKKNLNILRDLQETAKCKVILALKAFSAFSTFPLVKQYLSGTTATSLNEALLGHREFGGDLHVYAPAYSETDLRQLLTIAHHITFNSLSQFHRFRNLIRGNDRSIKSGLRINPEHSEVTIDLYNPCAPKSRLGVRAADLEGMDLEGISGLHFHTLCESDVDALQRTLQAVEKAFEPWLQKMSWINFGGGQQITRTGYNTKRLIDQITHFKKTYGLEVYLEPGEAVAWKSGILISQVLDITKNEMEIAILDTSAAAHMPDILEMPYRPEICNAGKPGEKKHTYRLGGLTCLA